MRTGHAKKYILAHDLGTSALKSSLVDSSGQIVSSCTEAYPTSQRFVGWAEQDPVDWWSAFCHNCRALTEDIPADAVAGVILTGQMMCCLPISADGEALASAMIWSDARANHEWRNLEEAVGAEALYQTAGMRGSANYSLPKMMWFQKNHASRYLETASFLSPKDYINYRLTGCFVTDSENAAYMYCYDQEKGTWSSPVLEAAGISSDKLPEVVPSGTIFGTVSACIAEDCGLKAGTPVIMGIGDGGAATLGAGVVDVGDAYTSLGTSSWVCAVTDKAQKSPGFECGISSLAFFEKQRLSGTMQAGGYAFSWFSDTFFPEEIQSAKAAGSDFFAVLNDMAQQSSPGANGCLFQPYLFGERSPLWDSRMRAAFLGMNARTTRGDLCRSVQEGVTMHLKWILDQICSCGEGRPIRSMRLIGGGAKSSLWQQIFADVYGVPVLTVKNPGQAAALGLAVIAGTTLGIFPDYSIINEIQPTDKTILPDPERQAFYAQLQKIYLHSVQCTQELNHRLAALSFT